MYKLFILLLIFPVAVSCYAQDTSINYLLRRIETQQIKTDAYFIPGIFPSYITNKQIFSEAKKDNNVFYNALIDYTLNDIKALLPKGSGSIAESILAHSKNIYPVFKNKKGRNSYNFWRTDTAYEFPFTGWIKYIKKDPEIPDDLDATSLAYMAQVTDSATAAVVHAQMQPFINNSSVKSINKKYRDYKAYSTWYGKKFPVVFDVCVMANVLCMVQRYNLQWTKADSTSFNFLLEVINSKDYLNDPLDVSPYYGNSSIILYHVARLMHIKQIPQLESIKEQLVAEAGYLLSNARSNLEKLMLCTVIIKLGYIPPANALPSNEILIKNIETDNLPFFIGNIPSYFKYNVKQKFTDNGWGVFYHYCPAYNNALLLEYMVLKNAIPNN